MILMVTESSIFCWVGTNTSLWEPVLSSGFLDLAPSQLSPWPHFLSSSGSAVTARWKDTALPC